MRSVWVVEAQWSDIVGAWHPVVGAKLTREEGQFELRDWKARNPDDKFRLVRYGPKR